MRPVKVRFLLAMLLLAMLPVCFTWAQSLSIYDDFDGNRRGRRYTSSSIPDPPPPACVSCRGSLGLPSGRGAEKDYDEMRDFAKARLAQQQREAEQRAKLEELLKEQRRLENIKTVEALRNLQRLQAELTELGYQQEEVERLSRSAMVQIVETMPKFERQRRQVTVQQLSSLQRLSQSIREIKVPPVPGKYDSVLILGTLNTAEDAQQAMKEGTLNPFIGRPYEGVFACGTKHRASEALRVSLDRLRADLGALSPSTLSKLGGLRGATVREVITHSNGAVVAEVLIRNNWLRGVKVFRILGGDASLMNLDRLNQLAREKEIDIYVYSTKNDVVSLLPTGWQIRGWAERLVEPLSQFRTAREMTYELLGLKRSEGAGVPRVHVQILSSLYPSTQTMRNHLYGTYAILIQGQRSSGCLDAFGQLNTRCTIAPTGAVRG